MLAAIHPAGFGKKQAAAGIVAGEDLRQKAWSLAVHNQRCHAIFADFLCRADLGGHAARAERGRDAGASFNVFGDLCDQGISSAEMFSEDLP